MHRSAIPSALVLLSLALPWQVTAQHEHRSPYSGQEGLEISSLTLEQLRELRAGEGMGLARAAELNHYPGPTHTLERATELHLSPGQVDRLADIRRVMLEQAMDKGREIIASERELTELFRGNVRDDASIQAHTAALGALYGELRAIHLVAHLRTAEMMTDEQIEAYDELRGYGN